jgi:hypothetical protein
MSNTGGVTIKLQTIVQSHNNKNSMVLAQKIGMETSGTAQRSWI